MEGILLNLFCEASINIAQNPEKKKNYRLVSLINTDA